MKGFLKIGFMVVFLLVSLSIFASERWPFPFWQHGWNCFTFWSITNAHPTQTVTCLLELKDLAGTQLIYKASSISPGANFQPATEGAGWFDQWENQLGYGTYEILTPHNTPEFDCVYVWACVYSHMYYQTSSFGEGHANPGFTIVDPGNPHGYTPPKRTVHSPRLNQVHTGANFTDSRVRKTGSRMASRSLSNRLVN